MSYDYVRRMYGVDPVPGERVSHHVTKREGTIRREVFDGRAYVHVYFDGDRFSLPCHPTELDYLGAPDDPINLAGSGPVAIEPREG